MYKRQHARSILSEETLDNKSAIRSISAKTFRTAITGNLYANFCLKPTNLRFETAPTGRLYCVFVTEHVKQC